MIGRLAALICLSTAYLVQTKEVPYQIYVVEVGGNVNLQCPVSGKEGKFFQWYKLPLGYMVQTLATGTYTQQTLTEQFNNPRFKVTEEEACYVLTIRNVSKDDEATYFCQSGTAYSQRLADTIFLAVIDRNQKKSVSVIQSPETASVKPGNSVPLQCSLLSKNEESSVQCPEEHSVFWFRAGSGESHPSIIYTLRNPNDEQTERSCVYTLSKTIKDSADTGTYYCVVVTFGEILFGEGTKVETRPELDQSSLVLIVLLACCVTLMIVLIFYGNRRRVCGHYKGFALSAGAKSASRNPRHNRSTVDQSKDLDDDPEEVNYAALNFSTRKVKTVKEKQDSGKESVYSAVRADYHT